MKSSRDSIRKKLESLKYTVAQFKGIGLRTEDVERMGWKQMEIEARNVNSNENIN